MFAGCMLKLFQAFTCLSSRTIAPVKLASKTSQEISAKANVWFVAKATSCTNQRLIALRGERKVNRAGRELTLVAQEQECNLRLLPPTASVALSLGLGWLPVSQCHSFQGFGGNCRCWDFNAASGSCTLQFWLDGWWFYLRFLWGDCLYVSWSSASESVNRSGLCVLLQTGFRCSSAGTLYRSHLAESHIVSVVVWPWHSGCGKQLHDVLQPSDGWWAGELTGNWHIFKSGTWVGESLRCLMQFSCAHEHQPADWRSDLK